MTLGELDIDMKGENRMKNDFSFSQKFSILVDSSNVYITSLKMRVKVDYEKLLERLNGRQLVRSIFYHVERDREREEPFIRRIQSMGFEVKAKQLKTYEDGTSK